MSWQDTHLNTHTSHDGLISSVSSPSFSRFQITFLPLQHSRHVCIWTQTLKNPHTTYTHTHTHTHPNPNFKSMANLIPEHPPHDSFLSSPCIMNRGWNEAIQSRPNTDQVLWIIDVLLTINWAAVFFFLHRASSSTPWVFSSFTETENACRDTE